MKFKFLLYVILIVYLTVPIYSLNLQTFEGAVNLNSIGDTEGSDIIKILNLVELKRNPSSEDSEEYDILKHKSKYMLQ